MIGPLRERVTLLEPQRTPDGGGGVEVTYAAGPTVWAASEDRTTGLARLAGRYARLIRRRYVMRASVAVGFQTRLRHDGHTFRVTGLQRREGRKPYLLVSAEEVR